MNEDEFFKQFSKETVFLKASSLDLSFIPDKLLCRDNIIENLIFNFRRILEEYEQPSINCLILGENGSGKTVTARFFGKNFKNYALEKKKRIWVEYFDCIYFRSKSKIIRELLAKYTHGSGKGLADDEAFKLILKVLIRENSYMILIIDDVHLLSSDDIFSLLAISETFGHQNVKLSIILVSTMKRWMAVETEDILSKLNSKLILKPYTFADIKSILEYRISLAFKKNVIDKDYIDLISKVVLNNGSMSNGILLLTYCGNMADEDGLDHISLDIIKTASDEMYTTFRTYIVEQLKDQELLTLYSIVCSLMNQNKPITTIDDAFDEYQRICEEYNIRPHIKKTFRKYIQMLLKLKMISSQYKTNITTGKGRYLEISLVDITPEKLEIHLKDIFGRKFGL
jgi:cell division control protein 6